MDYLAKKHPHKRDLCITFDEGPHIYTINRDSNYTSVTTWNHSHFEKFDADVIIGRMMFFAIAFSMGLSVTSSIWL